VAGGLEQGLRRFDGARQDGPQIEMLAPQLETVRGDP
jgi:hypothetical protein